jgi:hypothetical protein
MFLEWKNKVIYFKDLQKCLISETFETVIIYNNFMLKMNDFSTIIELKVEILKFIKNKV